MSQSISRRSFLKCAGSGAVSLAAALLTGVSAAAQQPHLAGEPALLDGKAAVELLGYAPAQEMGNVLVYLSVENLSAAALPVGASYLQSREVRTLSDLYSMGTGVTAVCDGKPVRCGSFAAPLYGENAADASVFTLNLTAGRGALLHCFCAVPEDWQTLELTWHPDFAAGRSAIFTVRHRQGCSGPGACFPCRGGQRGGPVKAPLRRTQNTKRPSEKHSKCLRWSFLFCQFSAFCPAESSTVSSCPVTLDTIAM